MQAREPTHGEGYTKFKIGTIVSGPKMDPDPANNWKMNRKQKPIEYMVLLFPEKSRFDQVVILYGITVVLCLF